MGNKSVDVADLITLAQVIPTIKRRACLFVIKMDKVHIVIIMPSIQGLDLPQDLDVNWSKNGNVS